VLVTSALAVCVALVYGSSSGENGSLSESKTESADQLRQENEQLEKQLSNAQQSIRALTSSLAESNAEAELFRRKYSDLALQMEALGLASASKDRAKLEQRLLAAVSDLQLAQKERDEYREQMLRLNEAILCYLKNSQGGDARARMELETQLRSLNTLLDKPAGAPAAVEPGLMDGSVVSVKAEWSFIVGNIGQKNGVKLGMPLRVLRNDRKIATVRVVDVRQKICGAVIQEMDSKKDNIQVGDRLQADVQPNVSLK